MSRLGKKPVKIPAGVKLSVKDHTVLVEGPKGKLTRTLPTSVKIEVKGDEINFVQHAGEDKQMSADHGLARQLVKNMVEGVSKTFSKTLVSVGVGYRMALQGKKLNISVGFSHPVVFELPEGVTGALQDQTKLTLTSADKELLGGVADKIRGVKPPEPYKGKGIRYENEQIVLKEGKAAAK